MKPIPTNQNPDEHNQQNKEERPQNYTSYQKATQITNLGTAPSMRRVLENMLENKLKVSSKCPKNPKVGATPSLAKNKVLIDELEQLNDKNKVLETRVKTLETCKDVVDTKSDSNLLARFSSGRNQDSTRSIVNHFFGRKTEDEEQNKLFLKSKLETSVLQTIVTPLESELNRTKKELKDTQNCMYFREKAEKTTRSHSLNKLTFDEARNLLGISSNLQCDEQKLRSIIQSYMVSDSRNKELQHLVNTVLDENEKTNKRLSNKEEEIKNLYAEIKSKDETHKDLMITWKKANESFIEQNINMNKQLEDMQIQLDESLKNTSNNSVDASLEIRVQQKQIAELKSTNVILHKELNKEKFNNAQLIDSLNDNKLEIAKYEHINKQIFSRWEDARTCQYKDFERIRYYVKKIEENYKISFSENCNPGGVDMEPLGNFPVTIKNLSSEVRTKSADNLMNSDQDQINPSSRYK